MTCERPHVIELSLSLPHPLSLYGCGYGSRARRTHHGSRACWREALVRGTSLRHGRNELSLGKGCAKEKAMPREGRCRGGDGAGAVVARVGTCRGNFEGWVKSQ